VLESLNYYKIIMAALNLVILYLILRKLLFKRVGEFMEKRAQSIRDSIKEAETQKAEAQEMKRAYEEQLGSAKSEAEKIMREAMTAAERERTKLILEAKKEAESILDKARERIEEERARMLKDMQTQIASLALAAASKVLEANMDTESNRVLVEKFIEETGVA
jgi:F-type H+-transporting ATPase subunit b